jgi:hypothetical protein
MNQARDDAEGVRILLGITKTAQPAPSRSKSTVNGWDVKDGGR